jgi:arylsulfatase A-like enzyme
MPIHKNVIVFYTDQQRADSLGCMGNPLARTPHLDALAARGVRYTRHYATNPVCMPSRCAFITGRYGQANGVIDNGIHLPARELTLPEVFRRAGYRTAAFGKLHFQTFKPTEPDVSFESYGRWNPGTLADWEKLLGAEGWVAVQDWSASTAIAPPAEGNSMDAVRSALERKALQ